MLVTELFPMGKKKSLVYIDYEKAFSLYNREIKKYDISVGAEIDEQNYCELMNEVFPKRCMERALYILGGADKTENQIKKALTENGYPLEIVDKTVDKLKRYGYINDVCYAECYIKQEFFRKSEKRIINELIYKGVEKEIIYAALNEYYASQDVTEVQKDLIKKELIKKGVGKDYLLDYREKNKIFMSLCRKGFEYEDINRVYDEICDN